MVDQEKLHGGEKIPAFDSYEARLDGLARELARDTGNPGLILDQVDSLVSLSINSWDFQSDPIKTAARFDLLYNAQILPLTTFLTLAMGSPKLTALEKGRAQRNLRKIKNWRKKLTFSDATASSPPPTTTPPETEHPLLQPTTIRLQEFRDNVLHPAETVVNTTGSFSSINIVQLNNELNALAQVVQDNGLDALKAFVADLRQRVNILLLRSESKNNLKPEVDVTKETTDFLRVLNNLSTSLADDLFDPRSSTPTSFELLAKAMQRYIYVLEEIKNKGSIDDKLLEPELRKHLQTAETLREDLEKQVLRVEQRNIDAFIIRIESTPGFEPLKLLREEVEKPLVPVGHDPRPSLIELVNRRIVVQQIFLAPPPELTSDMKAFHYYENIVDNLAVVKQGKIESQVVDFWKWKLDQNGPPHSFPDVDLLRAELALYANVSQIQDRDLAIRNIQDKLARMWDGAQPIGVLLLPLVAASTGVVIFPNASHEQSFSKYVEQTLVEQVKKMIFEIRYQTLTSLLDAILNDIDPENRVRRSDNQRLSTKDLQQYENMIPSMQAEMAINGISIPPVDVRRIADAKERIVYLIKESLKPENMTDDELAQFCKEKGINPFAWKENEETAQSLYKEVIQEFKKRITFYSDKSDLTRYLHLQYLQIDVATNVATNHLVSSGSTHADPERVWSEIKNALISREDLIMVTCSHPVYGKQFKKVLKALYLIPSLKNWQSHVPGDPSLKFDSHFTYADLNVKRRVDGGSSALSDKIEELTNDPLRPDMYLPKEFHDLLMRVYTTFNFLDIVLMQLMLTTYTRDHNKDSKAASALHYSDFLATIAHQVVRYGKKEHYSQMYLALVPPIPKGFEMGVAVDPSTLNHEDREAYEYWIEFFNENRNFVLAFKNCYYDASIIEGKLPLPKFGEELLYPHALSMVSLQPSETLQILDKLYDHNSNPLLHFHSEPNPIDSTKEDTVIYDVTVNPPLEVARKPYGEDKYYRTGSAKPEEFDVLKIDIATVYNDEGVAVLRHEGDLVFDLTAVPVPKLILRRRKDGKYYEPGGTTGITLARGQVILESGEKVKIRNRRAAKYNKEFKDYEQHFVTAFPAFVKLLDLFAMKWPTRLHREDLIEKGRASKGKQVGFIPELLNVWGQAKMWEGKHMTDGMAPLLADAVFMCFALLEANGMQRWDVFRESFLIMYHDATKGGLADYKNQVFYVLDKMYNHNYYRPASRRINGLGVESFDEVDFRNKTVDEIFNYFSRSSNKSDPRYFAIRPMDDGDAESQMSYNTYNYVDARDKQRRAYSKMYWENKLASGFENPSMPAMGWLSLETKKTIDGRFVSNEVADWYRMCYHDGPILPPITLNEEITATSFGLEHASHAAATAADEGKKE